MPSRGEDNLDIKLSLQPHVKAISCNDDLDENSGKEKDTLKNMPLYPNSILKKSTSANGFPHEEPIIDYDIDDEESHANQKISTEKKTKSQHSSEAFPNEEVSLDRPTAKPGRHTLLCYTSLFLDFMCSFVVGIAWK